MWLRCWLMGALGAWVVEMKVVHTPNAQRPFSMISVILIETLSH